MLYIGVTAVSQMPERTSVWPKQKGAAYMIWAEFNPSLFLPFLCIGKVTRL
jgi:hypothetical protein